MLGPVRLLILAACSDDSILLPGLMRKSKWRKAANCPKKKMLLAVVWFLRSRIQSAHSIKRLRNATSLPEPSNVRRGRMTHVDEDFGARP